MLSEWESGKPETVCGKGSLVATTGLIRSLLVKYVERYGIREIADVGCGDQNWITHVEWPHEVRYVGYDYRPRFTDVIPFDITREVLPKTEMVLCHYVLNHLSDEMRRRAYTLLKESGSAFLLTSYKDADEMPFDLVEKTFHKHRKITETDWYYGLWRMNDA